MLDPRPETETIVEAALSIFIDRRQEPLRILDLGVGSGALLCVSVALNSATRAALALIFQPMQRGSRKVILIRAACLSGPRFALATGQVGSKGDFDLIVSNPPYIPTADLAGLPREVRDFDPALALDGGIDGLDAYRRILPESRRLLAPGGWLITELGAGQATDVRAIANQWGFTDVRTHQDLAGVDRVLAARA